MENTYYGVLIGRDGPSVYTDWVQCEKAVSGFPGSCYTSFSTRQEAEAWVNSWAIVDVPSQLRVPSQYSECLHDSGHLSPPELHRHQVDGIKDDDDAVDLQELANNRQNEPRLSYEQSRVLERVRKGESVFFTGSAGTGKSFLLRKIIERLGGPSETLAVTASTGIAAVNIGGTTLHSFSGVGLGKGSADLLLERVQGSKGALERWQMTRILVVDEVSMIDGRLFDALVGELIARTVRTTSMPFGGIQLVLSGDFCQLPPVPDHLDGVSLPIKFAFEADSWNKCVGRPVMLQKVFRQEDKEFVCMLNRMRYGRIEKEDDVRLLALSREVKYDDGIEPTELFPLRREVGHANDTRLAHLPGPSQTYVSLDIPVCSSSKFSMTPKHLENLLERLVAVKRIALKIGAQVMLIKNLIPGQLVNGQLGKITAFKSIINCSNNSSRDSDFPELGKSSVQERVWPLVRFTNGLEILCVPTRFDVVNARGASEATREQIPLILAWAMSVHKSQGQTLERAKVNLARTFENGQAYVALSRARRMETLQVLHFKRSKVTAHPRVLEWNARVIREIQEAEELALVREMDNEESIEALSFEPNATI